MKEIFEAIESRIKSPLFGYFLISFVITNWSSLFYLFISNSNAIERIKYFNENTGYWSLIIYPAIIAMLISVIYPWVNLGILKLIKKPNELKNSLQAQSQHNLLITQNELEKIRSESFSTAEEELIGRAKRDAELEKIEDIEIKDKLKSEIEKLREQRGELKKGSELDLNNKNPQFLMSISTNYRERAEKSRTPEDRDELINKARELEEKAHSLILGKNMPNK